MSADINQSLLLRLQQLEDVEQIKRLKYRYFRSMDTGDFDTLQMLYTDDIKVDYIGGSYRWQMEGRKNLIDAQIASFNSEAIGCHTGHHPEIDILSDTMATGIWYMTDIFMDFRKKTVFHGSALYRDTYEKINGIWKIKITTYKRIYEQAENMETMPNITFSQLAEKLRDPQ